MMSLIELGEIMMLEDETVQKIKLLFVLERMEIPLTENNLVDICTASNNWFAYFDLKKIIYELIDSGFILEKKDPTEDSKFCITADGRNCLSHFEYKIPKTIREEIVAYAQENRLHLKRSQEYLSEYSKNEDGTYTVTLKIKDPSSIDYLLMQKLKVSNRQVAIDVAKKWTTKAPFIYEFIYDNLIDD